MKILVTGAAGFIGSHLTETLSNQDYEVKAVDCFLGESYDAQLKKINWEILKGLPNVKLLELDLRTSIPKSLLSDVEVIVNLAAMPGLMKSWSNFKVYSSCNINVVENLAREAVRQKVKHFIQISTSSVYGITATGLENSPLEPISPYGVTKLAAEELIKTYNRTFNLDFTILRYFSVYGPRQRPDMAYNKIIKAIINNQEIEIYGDGSQTRTNTYISDCVNATLSTIKLLPKNETINISGEFQYSLKSAIEFIEETLNKNAKLNFKEKRPGDQQETKGNISKAKSLLNYAPKIDLKAGLEKQVQWQMTNVKFSKI
jgi:UDP-glucuronate 4-epimerase